MACDIACQWGIVWLIVQVMRWVDYKFGRMGFAAVGVVLSLGFGAIPLAAQQAGAALQAVEPVIAPLEEPLIAPSERPCVPLGH
jgi:hypothetical protein|tara:strand:+ start:232 stop:483 length:252 start_codon:yes stop_codon:yes gene_type:complete